MKINTIFIRVSLLLSLAASVPLFCMDELDTHYTPLDSALGASVITTPKTTTRGLGLIRSSFDFIWNEEDNLFSDLTTKKFDPNNSSYHRKLDAAVETFTTKQNSNRLTETLAICRKEYGGQVKVGDISATMAHEFLVQENKHKQKTLKELLETKDKQFIEKQNILLATLQKSLNDQLTILCQNLNDHLKDRNTAVQKEGSDIRRIKEALLNLHKLNKTFVLPTDAYCSDTEETNPEKVNIFYNDSHLLKKIKVDQSMNDTKTKMDRTIARLAEINSSIQSIPEPQY